MTKEELLKKYGSINAAAKDLKIPRQTLYDRLNKGVVVQKSDGSGKKLSDFRAVHDKSFYIPQRIKEGLEKLGDGWEYEMQFAKLAGVSLADLGVFRPQFEDFVVNVDRTKRAWAGTRATATKMREMVR